MRHRSEIARGRPRCRCRPTAVPGPACPGARGSRPRAHTSWVSASLDGVGVVSSERAEGGGVLGACPVTRRETAPPIPIASDPRRKRRARGAAPLRLGLALPLAPERRLHPLAANSLRGRSRSNRVPSPFGEGLAWTSVFVRMDERPERRLHPLAADSLRGGSPTPPSRRRSPPGWLTGGRSTGTRRRWFGSSLGSLRVPAAASSRGDALEPAPLIAVRVLRRPHGASP